MADHDHDKTGVVFLCSPYEETGISTGLARCVECGREVGLAPSTIKAIAALKANGETYEVCCLTPCATKRYGAEALKGSQARVTAGSEEEFEAWLDSDAGKPYAEILEATGGVESCPRSVHDLGLDQVFEVTSRVIQRWLEKKKKARKS